MMGKSYSVEITDELEAESPKEALRDMLERLRSEETVAVVTQLETGEIFHIECQTGEDLSTYGITP
tara:strand:- start:234 stop:431 length:198 start_codon:yes stop_codon:yes gene_type:complete